MGSEQIAKVMSIVRKAKAHRTGEKFDEKADALIREMVEEAAEKIFMAWLQAVCLQMMELLILEI